MNYQQEMGYYEMNPVYLKHPSKQQVYTTKIIEIGLVYGATKLFPEYEKEILQSSNIVCWGFIVTDSFKGINLGFRW